VKIRNTNLEIQNDPRLEGEPFMFATRNQSIEWNCLQVRVGPFLIFFEKKVEGIPAE